MANFRQKTALCSDPLVLQIKKTRCCVRYCYRLCTTHLLMLMGSRVGAVARALAHLTHHRYGPGSILSSDDMWAKFVVGSFSAPRGFPPGTPVFSSPQKPAFLNSNSTWNARTLNT